ncbi:hypothetical protein BLA29_011630 [Euroglyphus maynei]|uniref:Uncharacterized protein n=1 Tax=Euroglyphus maynei TaxID=6958 RepID=A0A1Y3BQK3_EURMA|nr:hypothetical protein BLA29_011630 [Euroglyphus maynei]
MEKQSRPPQPPSSAGTEKRERRSGLSNVSLSKAPLLQIGADENERYKYGHQSSSSTITVDPEKFIIINDSGFS